ncbi:MAG: hypothetical protein C5B50_26460 [Verrucomicrobia bacterium]|nr:MAG: hypothetical protein C5B50_26460 [Verrucomicrobiota bacterium]
MTKLFCVLTLITFDFAGLAQTNPPTPATGPAPKIAFEHTSFDFGKVECGQPVKHSFIFTNVGDATLEVTDVHPGCGCTTAGAWDKKAEPGKTGLIPIQFNTSGYNGHVGKSITVTCSDPSQKVLSLSLNGTVWKPIDVIPSAAAFTLFPDHQTKETRVLKIVNNLDDLITISAPTNRNAAFEVEFKTNTIGKEFELRVTVIPPIGEGTISARFDLPTTSARVPMLNVSAYATGQPRFTLIPNMLTLPPGPLEAVSEQSFTIQNNTTNSLVVSEPTVQTRAGLSAAIENMQGVDVQIKEAMPGKTINISLSFPAGFKIEGGKSAELRLKSNLPHQAAIVMPILQPLRQPSIAEPTGPPQAKRGS